MMAREKALGISFEMAEIGEIGKIVEIGTFISPFRWCKKPPLHLDKIRTFILVVILRVTVSASGDFAHVRLVLAIVGLDTVLTSISSAHPHTSLVVVGNYGSA